MLGLVEMPDQEEAPDPRCRACAAFTRSPCCCSSVARAVSSAFAGQPRSRSERDLGLGDDAPRAGYDLFRTEGMRRTAHEGLRSIEISELRHRDAAKCQRRRVVAEGDPVQCAEPISRRERTRRGRDERVHRNPATFVTLKIRYPTAIYLTTTTISRPRRE
jgi:hypothetical protein